MNLREYIRTIPDFPVPGIRFRDITPLVGDAAAYSEAVKQMTRHWVGEEVDLVAAMEARGFIFGAALAIALGAGFVPVRKTGKLPFRTKSLEYQLEYRNDILHIHEDAVKPGQRVLVVDDLIATGGTALAVAQLVELLGGQVVGFGFLVELSDLKGREVLAGYDVRSEIEFSEDD
ncbi:MAG: adenine phosphoribosyltransferase [Candidatus Rokuibacteriota bacterium]|nr:MAG: adenine phosphoribosyltransferase [Candidatus Rokubacteria bacterium]